MKIYKKELIKKLEKTCSFSRMEIAENIDMTYQYLTQAINGYVKWPEGKLEAYISFINLNQKNKKSKKESANARS